MIIVEAEICGVSAITADIEGESEIVKNEQDGILVGIRDRYVIAQALILDVKLYDEMAFKACESSKMFSSDQF